MIPLGIIFGVNIFIVKKIGGSGQVYIKITSTLCLYYKVNAYCKNADNCEYLVFQLQINN